MYFFISRRIKGFRDHRDPFSSDLCLLSWSIHSLHGNFYSPTFLMNSKGSNKPFSPRMAAIIFYKTSISIFCPKFQQELTLSAQLFVFYCLGHLFHPGTFPAPNPCPRQLLHPASPAGMFAAVHPVSPIPHRAVPVFIAFLRNKCSQPQCLSQAEVDAVALQLCKGGRRQCCHWALWCSFPVWGFVLCLFCQVLGFLPLESCQCSLCLFVHFPFCSVNEVCPLCSA